MSGRVGKTPAIKRRKLVPDSNTEEKKVNDDQVVIDKSRSKYLKSLGMVPRG